MTDTEIRALLDSAERTLSQRFLALEETERTNFARVMDAFRAEHVAVRHFAPTTGYGYGDDGRDALERIFARIFGCEDALVRPSIASGTHALALCLFGLLRPGDVLVAGSGKPYDTLESVIGLTGDAGQGSLREYGIGYAQVDLKDDDVDLPALLQALKDPRAKVVALQRSRGYDWRASLTVERLGEVAQAVHAARPDVVVWWTTATANSSATRSRRTWAATSPWARSSRTRAAALRRRAAISWAARTSSRSAPAA